jgi:hypothetical protein
VRTAAAAEGAELAEARATLHAEFGADLTVAEAEHAHHAAALTEEIKLLRHAADRRELTAGEQADALQTDNESLLLIVDELHNAEEEALAKADADATELERLAAELAHRKDVHTRELEEAEASERRWRAEAERRGQLSTEEVEGQKAAAERAAATAAREHGDAVEQLRAEHAEKVAELHTSLLDHGERLYEAEEKLVEHSAAHEESMSAMQQSDIDLQVMLELQFDSRLGELRAQHEDECVNLQSLREEAETQASQWRQSHNLPVGLSLSFGVIFTEGSGPQEK